jgi:Transposase, Mutator family
MFPMIELSGHSASPSCRRVILESMSLAASKKCCYPYQRFQSNEEREFAVLIDSNNEAAVLRWMKPGAGQFRIEYANGQSYEPDFVVETRSQKLIVEIKAANEIRDVLLEFYDFFAAHWKHLRTTNPIESTFATVRHRTIRSKGCLSNKTALVMVFKLVEGAQKTWRRLDGQNQLPKIMANVKFDDGIEASSPQAKAAA